MLDNDLTKRVWNENFVLTSTGANVSVVRDSLIINMAQYTFVSDWLQLTAVNYELCTIGVRREWRPESAKIMLGDIGTNYVRE